MSVEIELNEQNDESIRELIEAQAEKIQNLENKVSILEHKTNTNSEISDVYQTLFSAGFTSFSIVVSLILVMVTIVSLGGIIFAYRYRRKDKEDLVLQAAGALREQVKNGDILNGAVVASLKDDTVQKKIDENISQPIRETMDAKIQEAIKVAFFEHEENYSISKFRKLSNIKYYSSADTQEGKNDDS